MKILRALIVVLLFCLPSFSQQSIFTFSATSPNSSIDFNWVGTGIQFHQMSWFTTGTVSSCTVALDSSTNGSSYTAGGIIAGQTCTSNGASTITALVSNHGRITFTTLSGGGTVTVVYDGWVAAPASLAGNNSFSGQNSFSALYNLDGAIYCDGNKYPTLNAAAAAVSNPGVVVVPLGSVCPVTSNLTIPTTTTLIFQSSSQVNVANATTLTINGPIVANINQRIFSFTGSGNVVMGGLASQRISPMWWGALCDTSTDDTTAFQATITAAGNNATIVLPTGVACIIGASGTKALNADSTNDLTIKSDSEVIGISGLGRPVIIFTGTPSVAGLSAQSSNRFTCKGLKIQYNNASFTHNLLDLTNGANPTLDHCFLTGGGSGAVAAAKLVDFTGVTDGIRLLFSSFGNALICADLGGSSAPVIIGDDFGSASAPCSTTALTGLAQGSLASGITFEMLTDTGTQTALDGSNPGALGSLLGGLWFGDMATGYTGPLIKLASGTVMTGNRLQGISTATAIQINGGQQSFAFIGNYVSGFGTVFSCNAPINQALVAANTFTSVTTFQSGCFVGGTTQGLVIDNNNKASPFGTGTNDNATAGAIGEVISSTIATGSSVSLSTGTAANVTSVSLTAGDWDCSGAVDFTFGATTSVTNLAGSISQSTGAMGSQDSGFDSAVAAMVPTSANDATFPLPVVRESLSTTTTVFLVAKSSFTLSTAKAYGTIRCRRVR